MMTRILSFAAFTALAATACTTVPPSPPAEAPLTSLYDYRIVDPDSGQAMALPQLASALQNADVVFIGELHGHNGAHLLQARLQQALYQQQPLQVLAMEQFTVEHQPSLDRYLAGELGEAEMIEDADAWDNYRASYRPLVDFALAHDLPVIAGNAPAQLVRCVGRQGPDYLTRAPKDLQALLPGDPFYGTAPYREKFLATLTDHQHGPGDPERLENSYRAQLLRDNTMASRIVQALADHPGAQVVHTNGTFHSEHRLGTVAALKARAPELTVRVISPVVTDVPAEHVSQDDREKGDYLYYLRPLQEDYLDRDRELQAMMKRFRQASENNCET